MEGIYENFPDLHHGIAVFSYKTPPQNLQRALICLFYELNQGEEDFEIPLLANHGIHLTLDIGIADTLTFNFIDEEEKGRWLSLMEKRIFEILDFILIARYYVSEEGKRKSLKFDYYMLRFIFKSGIMELRVHHEKGTRRLPLEDLIRLIGEKINQKLKEKGEDPIILKSLSAF